MVFWRRLALCNCCCYVMTKAMTCRYKPGSQPPAPRRVFRNVWDARCSGVWRRSFYMFSAGMPPGLQETSAAAWPLAASAVMEWAEACWICGLAEQRIGPIFACDRADWQSCLAAAWHHLPPA